ncbi:MAG: MiaB/RimO family radical SAM methylthiotransferase [Acidimicrobiales bacterium]
MSQKFLIRTFGCQMNEHDSERLAGQFVAEGMEATDDLEAADVVVLNTCCIRENADNRLYGHLGHLKALKERRPGMQIAVGGCLAQKDGALVRERAPQVDAVFGTHNLAAATGLLRRAAAEGPVTEILDASSDDEVAFPSALPARRNLPYAAWVTIQVGCDNACAFCIVPAVRGPEASRPFGQVVGEVEALARTGVTEVTLLGQNVNSYGRDITTRLRAQPHDPAAAQLAGPAWAGSVPERNAGSVPERNGGSAHRRARPLFADLLRAVGSVDGIRRVRFTSPHPKDLRPETIEAMADTPAICDHLHLPLQAGSNRTLAAMHRGYTAERYLGRLAEARAAMPDLAVTTDLIVGFPGETDDDFERTLEVVAEAGYDSAYTFVFSPRPGTAAAAMTDRFVPPEVTAERFERLRVVVERSALRRHQARVGRVEEVLVEGPSKRDITVTTGRTGQNKLVHFEVRGLAPTPGSYATVAVTGAAPHYLRGELVEITARSRHRSLIPVASS